MREFLHGDRWIKPGATGVGGVEFTVLLRRHPEASHQGRKPPRPSYARLEEFITARRHPATEAGNGEKTARPVGRGARRTPENEAFPAVVTPQPPPPSDQGCPSPPGWSSTSTCTRGLAVGSRPSGLTTDCLRWRSH